MIKTQVYLTEEESIGLKSLAALTGKKSEKGQADYCFLKLSEYRFFFTLTKLIQEEICHGFLGYLIQVKSRFTT